MGKFKRASLSLSINAIVVLVLAITMLGLGLAFTKGMFGKFAAKLTVPEPDIPATADDQIVLPADTIQVRKNKEVIFSVNVYNNDWGSTSQVTGSMACGTSGPSATAVGQPIPSGEDAMFKFILDKTQTSSVMAGTHVCTLTFTADSIPISKQIVIAIK
ncbi:hypothetical protein ACFL96_11760 [Thermoproteota archaeon]